MPVFWKWDKMNIKILLPQILIQTLFGWPRAQNRTQADGAGVFTQWFNPQGENWAHEADLVLQVQTAKQIVQELWEQVCTCLTCSCVRRKQVKVRVEQSIGGVWATDSCRRHHHRHRRHGHHHHQAGERGEHKGVWATGPCRHRHHWIALSAYKAFKRNIFLSSA